MKQHASVGILLAALAACAPAQSTPARTGPAPTPGAAPATPPAAATTQGRMESGAPVSWWQLDPATDRVRGMGAQRAYRELLAGRQPRRSVVVAIIDSGIDVEHEDLDGVLWVNEDEVPGNRIDDDRNGYVDDVHGWNFIGGRDGRNVEDDTWEVARLYGIYERRFANVRADTLAGAARRDYEEWLRVREDLQQRRSNAQQQLQQVQTIERAYDTLRRALGTQTLTRAAVTGLTPSSPDVAQAKSIYLQLAANGVTPEQVAQVKEYSQSQIEFGLNPSFDPRSIVGDNYADPNDRNYGNNDYEGPDASHGTHVAGIVAAERGNGIGIDGIANAARIMVIRAVPNGDERDKDVANAIRYAVDNGAHIINMSFGKGYSPRKDVVDAAVRYADEKGVLMVHGSGNDGTDITSAGNFPNRFYLDGGAATRWIEVGASSWHGADTLVADFSNYSRERVDVFAPGVDIYSSTPGNKYEENSGTSMASPVVAGLAALLMSYFPELNAAEIRQVILGSATRYAADQVIGPGEAGRVPFGNLSVTGGIVNAYAAVQAAERMAAAKRN